MIFWYCDLSAGETHLISKYLTLLASLLLLPKNCVPLATSDLLSIRPFLWVVIIEDRRAARSSPPLHLRTPKVQARSGEIRRRSYQRDICAEGMVESVSRQPCSRGIDSTRRQQEGETLPRMKKRRDREIRRCKCKIRVSECIECSVTSTKRLQFQSARKILESSTARWLHDQNKEIASGKANLQQPLRLP